MKNVFLSILLIVCYSISVNAQVKNLDKIPQSKRDSIILELAKKAILKYGPEFYEKDKIPVITRGLFEDTENRNRVTYIVSYRESDEYYKMHPNAHDLARVYVWEDSGLVHSVMFQARGVTGLDKDPESDFLKKIKRRYLNKK